MLPGSRILDPQFLVLDITDAVAGCLLKLPPYFSLAFQAIYEWFHEKDWKAAESLPLLERLWQLICQQLSVSFKFLIFFCFIYLNRVWLSHL